MSKKGAVELSLTFIIIIIIGVIVLGVGLALITGGLETVKTLWYNALGQAETTLTEDPTVDEPVVISLGNPATITAGIRKNVEIAILNNKASSISGAPTLTSVSGVANTCTGSDWLKVGGQQSIASGEIKKWTGTLTIPTTERGKTLFCDLGIGSGTNRIKVEFVVNVEK